MFTLIIAPSFWCWQALSWNVLCVLRFSGGWVCPLSRMGKNKHGFETKGTITGTFYCVFTLTSDRWHKIPRTFSLMNLAPSKPKRSDLMWSSLFTHHKCVWSSGGNIDGKRNATLPQSGQSSVSPHIAFFWIWSCDQRLKLKRRIFITFNRSITGFYLAHFWSLRSTVQCPGGQVQVQASVLVWGSDHRMDAIDFIFSTVGGNREKIPAITERTCQNMLLPAPGSSCCRS